MADPESLRVSLKYEGPDVNDGSMAINDIVPALQGFASAYEKIATFENLSHEHRLRVAGLTKSSAELHITVLEWVANNATPLTVLGGFASTVVGLIIGVIKLKQHTQGKASNVSAKASSDNHLTVNNHLKVSLEVNPKEYDIFSSELINTDLSRMVRPLHEKRIDDLVLALPDLNYSAMIRAGEKDIFDVEHRTITTTKEIWLEGFLDSLSKSRNRGTFYLKGGRSVSYKLASDNPADLYIDFAYNGPVKVRCLAHLNENLEPVLIEISEIQKLQRNLFT
jgi:hypothetical protein